MGLERAFQRKLIKDIMDCSSRCMVINNDPDYIQEIPDLTVLYKDKWASLEVKKSAGGGHRPSQEHEPKQKAGLG